MVRLLLILVGGIVLGAFLIWFLNLTTYSNSIKALLCVFIGVIIFLVLKILDPLIYEYEIKEESDENKLKQEVD